MTLTWKRASEYHLESGCGRYTVAKVTVLGVTRYEAWMRSPSKLLGHHDTAEQAKARCETHARGA